MVIVLTKTDWEALTKILVKIKAWTRHDSNCAILVHPAAAAAYLKRTGRNITDWDSHIDYAFDPPDYSLDLIGPNDAKFAKKGTKAIPDWTPYCLQAILKSIGRGPDGITEAKSCTEKP